MHRRCSHALGQRVQIVQQSLVLLGQPLVDVLQIVGHIQLLHFALALQLVQLARSDQELLLERLLVDLQVGHHAQQRLEQRPIDGVAVALLLDQMQQALDGALLHRHVDGNVIAEQIQAHVPDRVDGRILQHVRAVQVEEDAADHDHLLAVRQPAVVHALQIDQLVHDLAEEQLDVLLDVLLGERGQFRVQLRVHLVAAHVLHRLVQLLQRVDDRRGRLDGDDGRL